MDKQAFTTDISTLKLQEDQEVVAKGWRRKKEKRDTEESRTTTITDKTPSSLVKQIHTEDTSLLDISETEREDKTKSAQVKDWRKQRKAEDKTTLKLTEEEITLEKKPTDRSIAQQVHTEEKLYYKFLKRKKTTLLESRKQKTGGKEKHKNSKNLMSKILLHFRWKNSKQKMTNNLQDQNVCKSRANK